jgi:hypothetical protein
MASPNRSYYRDTANTKIVYQSIGHSFDPICVKFTLGEAPIDRTGTTNGALPGARSWETHFEK